MRKWDVFRSSDPRGPVFFKGTNDLPLIFNHLDDGRWVAQTSDQEVADKANQVPGYSSVELLEKKLTSNFSEGTQEEKSKRKNDQLKPQGVNK